MVCSEIFLMFTWNWKLYVKSSVHLGEFPDKIGVLLLCGRLIYWYSSWELFYVFFTVTAHGINAGDVKKLQDAGIYTCNGLMMHTKKVNI